MPTQLNKLALQDTSDLTTTQLFSIFQEGAEEASRQVIDIEANTAIKENNREVITSKVYRLTATGDYSNAARTQLGSWRDVTELKVSGFGLDKSILQADRIINVKEGFEDNASFRFISAEEAVGGYNPITGKHSANISYCKNGLALYRWQEGETTNLAAGWSRTNGAISWSGGVQTFSTTSTSVDAFMFRDVYFPFAGQQVAFGISSTGATVTDVASIQILAYDSAGSTIGSASSTAITSGGAANYAVSRTLPANTEYIRVRIQVLDASVSFQNPYLALGASGVFEEFNT